MADIVNIHGTAIAVGDRAVLIRGRQGAGKSDLALRCLAVPAGPFATQSPHLVADDRVMAEAVSGSVRVFAPNVLSGLIEVRGVGIVRVGCAAAATLVLVADLAECSEIERLPEPLSPAVICGIEVRRVLLAPFEGSAPLKLLLALSGAATA